MQLDQFEAEQTRLTSIATRILGSTSDVDDVVQEARLRLAQAEGIDDVPAWLTTVVTRLCLDALRRRRVRERVEAGAAHDSYEAEQAPDDVDLAERVGGAVQIVLDAVTPAERVAFVLHEVFGYSFDEVGASLGRSNAAVRQLASRARRKIQGLDESDAERAAAAEHRKVGEAFLAAARSGDLAQLLSLLDPDAVMRADSVGQAMGTKAVYDGAAAVADRFNGAKGAVAVTIDGQFGAAWIADGAVKVAFALHVAGGVVSEIELIADPEVLENMAVVRLSNRRNKPT